MNPELSDICTCLNCSNPYSYGDNGLDICEKCVGEISNNLAALCASIAEVATQLANELKEMHLLLTSVDIENWMIDVATVGEEIGKLRED